jgi:adenine/guanine phosphoribosyltransferase-like PRPP-binding protein
MKKFLTGFVIGALIAFHLGINFGRHRPLLSNPYADDVVEEVKERAGQAMESTKEVIHEATEPTRKGVERKLSR